MGSEARLKGALLLAFGAMLGLAMCAGAVPDSPRLLVLCALAALAPAGLAWFCLNRLGARAPAAAERGAG
ncbi:ATP-binding protein, partial [Massilia glaciei]